MKDDAGDGHDDEGARRARDLILEQLRGQIALAEREIARAVEEARRSWDELEASKRGIAAWIADLPLDGQTKAELLEALAPEAFDVEEAEAPPDGGAEAPPDDDEVLAELKARLGLAPRDPDEQSDE